MNIKTKAVKIAILLIVVILANVVRPFSMLQIAHALALTSLSDTLSTLKASTLANHEIKFVTPASGGVAAGETITYTFSAGFVMGSQVLADWDFASGSTNNCSSATFTEKALLGTASGASWGAAVSGQVITITSGTDTIAADRCIRLKVGANAVSESAGTIRITNPTASSPTVTIGGTFGDTGTITVNVIADDQVAVTSSVGQSISFSLGANSLNLGTLSSSTASSGSHTLTVATNATSGMVVSVAGATLTSGGNTITACAAGCTSTTGTEQFGINLKDNATPNVGLEVSGTAPIGAAATGYATADNFRFVTGETIASSAAGINSSVFTVSYLTNIAGATEYGTYTATMTYTATGSF